MTQDFLWSNIQKQIVNKHYIHSKCFYFFLHFLKFIIFLNCFSFLFLSSMRFSQNFSPFQCMTHSTFCLSFCFATIGCRHCSFLSLCFIGNHFFSSYSYFWMTYLHSFGFHKIFENLICIHKISKFLLLVNFNERKINWNILNLVLNLNKRNIDFESHKKFTLVVFSSYYIFLRIVDW